MTSLGNVKSSYGKTFSIAVANTYSNIVLSGANLPENTIIISSNVDDNNDDTGSYSLLITDNNGNPVRLTYNIIQGEGLEEDENNADVLKLNIDDKYVKYSSAGLHVDLSNFIADNVYVNDEGKFAINTDKIVYADENNKGILKVDDNTVKIDDSTLRVDTTKLALGNNFTNQYGVVSSTDGIINIDNGIVSVNENNLPISGEEEYGLSKGDEHTISVLPDSSLKVNTENLDIADETKYGIISVDSEKIVAENGKVSVNTNKLEKANYTQKGIINIDNESIVLNENNQITVNKFEEIMSDINELEQSFNDIKIKFSELKDEILAQINE